MTRCDQVLVRFQRDASTVTPVSLKFVRVIVTVLPNGPYVGLKDVIVGAGAVVIVKLVALALAPALMHTRAAPVVAPEGTTTVAEVALDAECSGQDSASFLGRWHTVGGTLTRMDGFYRIRVTDRTREYRARAIRRPPSRAVTSVAELRTAGRHGAKKEMART